MAGLRRCLAIDFAVLPPEINSTLMYSGPGSGSMIAAAAAWNGLAADLSSAATSYASVVSNLTIEPWLGPGSTAMASAVAPYVGWMHATAAQAAQTATQAKVAAVAYETAFTATVPPSVIAANRALLASLIATNILGQNAPAIAATQADYAEMWAQDVAAMYGYSASSATAAELTPFMAPEQETNPGGQDEQAAAADAAGNGTQNALSAVPQTLQQLASPLQAAPVQAVVDDPGVEVATATGVSGLTLGSAYHAAIGSTNFFQRLVTQFTQPQGTDLTETVNKIAVATGAVESEDALQQPASPFHGLGSWQNWLKLLKNLGAHAFHTSATAGMGQAPMVGGLSVPQAWTATAPEIHLAAAELPSVSADAAPAVEDGGAGGLGAQAALAGMAGRALAGTAAPGGRQGIGSTTRERVKSSRRSSGSSATGTAAELRESVELLREFGKLRDSGLLTDEEFDEQKRQLLSLTARHLGR